MSINEIDFARECEVREELNYEVNTLLISRLEVHSSFSGLTNEKASRFQQIPLVNDSKTALKGS